MLSSDYTTTLLADQSPEEVFNTINDIDRWWPENRDGTSHQLNDELTVFFGIHISTQTDRNLTSFQDKQEWTGVRHHTERR